ncbi:MULTISPECIES: hypothetical protein [unclassified Mycoplasma]|uniref:hypothetical protein n=1 Tax=unclassified Mycoplasma TaxID=2683645 RepID=UPI002B1D4E66|nr:MULTISPECIES: hypothetical protein [unclassified Mycoplasma]MEA4162748.1 hypothetical protein [Mycoplasma sp. 4404]MEA4206320.1 hypothetical protein [Mycoplasma sp. 1199]
MESKFLNVLNIVGSTPSMVMPTNQPITARAVNAETNETNNPEKLEMEVIKEIDSFIAENEKSISEISNKVVEDSKKHSAKKTVELMDDSKIEDLILRSAQKQIQNKTGNNIPIEEIKQQASVSGSKKLDEAKAQFKKEMHKKLIDIKKNEKKTKGEVKEFENKVSSKIIRKETDSALNFAVNIDGTVSSKTLIFQYKELEKQSKYLKDVVFEELKHIERLQETKVAFLIISITASAVAAAATIASFFTLGTLALLSAISTGVAVAAGIVVSALEGVISHRKSVYKKLVDVYDYMFTENVAAGVWSASTLWPTFAQSVVELKEAIYELAFIGTDKISKSIGYSVKTISHGAKFFSLGSSAISLASGVVDLVETGKDLDANLKKQNALLDRIAGFSNQMSKMEKIEWVVIDETKLDKPYNEGGRGGKNQYFFNLKTKQTRHLSHFLNMSRQELAMNGFIKVKSKTRGQYIKRIPNKTKEDNLG